MYILLNHNSIQLLRQFFDYWAIVDEVVTTDTDLYIKLAEHGTIPEPIKSLVLPNINT